jgi:hypothetical protein
MVVLELAGNARATRLRCRMFEFLDEMMLSGSYQGRGSVLP